MAAVVASSSSSASAASTLPRLSEAVKAANVKDIVSYHNLSKHFMKRFARSLGWLDWATQPDPFREFVGAKETELPLPDAAEEHHHEPVSEFEPSYEQLFHNRRGSTRHSQLGIGSISEFFFHSLALSAWKATSNTSWSLRVNPSSGNLHPTEGYIILPGGFDEGGHTDAGVFHYKPNTHSLERRTVIKEPVWSELTKGLPKSSFFVGLTSIHWRESWKYGERAFRYCQHDCGHAIAALRLAASLLGWKFHLLTGVRSELLKPLLGLHNSSQFIQEEEEEAEVLALVITDPTDNSVPGSYTLSNQAVEAVASGVWEGKAKRLSVGHHAWPLIQEAAIASRNVLYEADSKPDDSTQFNPLFHSVGIDSRPNAFPLLDKITARKIIRQRRSALDMDGFTRMSKADFFRMLSRLTPSMTQVPWDAVNWTPSVHLFLFVHRVEGLDPGLYFFCRHGESLPFLKENIVHANADVKFCWVKPDGTPKELDFYMLVPVDIRKLAGVASCTQEIASNGTFSVSMVSIFESLIHEHPHNYRRMFWEAGMIGQLLYLESEAVGLRGTGIGCYFDDYVHSLVGIREEKLQALYHFAVGKPIEDERLQQRPAYHHLRR